MVPGDVLMEPVCSLNTSPEVLLLPKVVGTVPVDGRVPVPGPALSEGPLVVRDEFQGALSPPPVDVRTDVGTGLGPGEGVIRDTGKDVVAVPFVA